MVFSITAPATRSRAPHGCSWLGRAFAKALSIDRSNGVHGFGADARGPCSVSLHHLHRVSRLLNCCSFYAST